MALPQRGGRDGRYPLDELGNSDGGGGKKVCSVWAKIDKKMRI